MRKPDVAAPAMKKRRAASAVSKPAAHAEAVKIAPSRASRARSASPVVASTKDSPGRPTITGAAFWALMDSWRVPDEGALRLIGHTGGLPASGKRPRFTLRGEQVERMELLRQIDQHLVDMFDEAAPWLARKNPAPEFARKTPLACMVADPARAVAASLRFLERHSFKASLARR